VQQAAFDFEPTGAESVAGVDTLGRYGTAEGSSSAALTRIDAAVAASARTAAMLDRRRRTASDL
jgi:hypothetical protein